MIKQIFNTNLKGKLTVIVPTHERHHVLNRSVEYLSSFNCHILIVDSSLLPLKLNLPSNFQYLHQPNCSFGEKLYAAINKVDTPYSCLCADDDFLSKSGLRSGVDFLERNIDFVSVQGHYIQFNSKDVLKRYHPLYENLVGCSNYSEVIKERVKNAFLIPQVYAMHRTEILNECLKVTSDLLAVSVVEICIQLVSSCFGKHKIIPVFWSARDMNQYSSYVDLDGDGYQSNKMEVRVEKSNVIIDDWSSYLNSDEGVKFKNNFSKVIGDLNISPSAVYKLFDLAFEEYIEKNNRYLKKKYIDNKRFVVRMKKIVKHILPILFIHSYRFFFQKYRIKESTKLRNEYIKIDGYPWSDVLAMRDWGKMKNIIIKYKQLL